MGKALYWLSAVILLVNSVCLYAAEIGHVTEIEDNVELIRDGSVFSLEPGVTVSDDDIVKTGDNGIAQIEMLDGSVLDIGPSSELHIAEYHLEENKQLKSGEVSLLAGWLRFVTSKLSTDRSFGIATPTMAIGIRGTEGLVAIDEDSSQLELTTGQVNVVGIDDQGNDFQVSRSIKAGEFIQHNVDGTVQHLPQSPESFRQRKHPRFKVALVRKLQKLARRGVLPKKLRNASVDDFKRALKTNPRIRARLIKHLKKRLKDPEFRSNLKKRLKNNPKLREKLKNSKVFKQSVRQFKQEKQQEAKREKARREKLKQEKIKRNREQQ